MSFHFSPKIINNGLSLCFDTANTRSYSGTGSNWIDLVSLDYRGVLTNSPTFNSSNNGHLIFDGLNDYVITNYTTPFGISNLTIGLWISYTASQQSGILSKRTSINFEQLSIFIGGDVNVSTAGTKIVINDFNGGVSRNAITSNSYNDGLWHYLVLVRDTNENRLYIDNQLVSTIISTKPDLSTASTLFFGVVGNGNSVDGFYYNGKLSQIQLYNRTLLVNEIQQNYDAQKTRFL